MEDTTFNLGLCALVFVVIMVLIIMLYRKKDSYGYTGTGRGYGSLGFPRHVINRHHNPQSLDDVRNSRYKQIKNLANNPFYGHDDIKAVRHSVNIDSNKYERDDMEDDPSEDSATQARYRRTRVRTS
jgi:hypothetical protein